MPPTTYIKPEVTAEPMDDVTDLALSQEADKPASSADFPGTWSDYNPYAYESQFQALMPPGPFPPPPAMPPQSVRCSDSQDCCPDCDPEHSCPEQSPKNQTSGGNNRTLQDYQMQLMLLEQQNKKRLMMARQEQDATNTTLKPQDRPSVQEKADYQMQLMLLEQQNKKRLMMAKQEQDATKATPNPQDTPYPQDYKKATSNPQDPPCVQDDQTQEMLLVLERQNNKRLMMARQELAAMKAPNPQDPLPDYQMQLMLLEQQNKIRLMMAKQEKLQDAMTLAPERKDRLLENWEADYQRELHGDFQQKNHAAEPSEQAEKRRQQDPMPNLCHSNAASMTLPLRTATSNGPTLPGKASVVEQDTAKAFMDTTARLDRGNQQEASNLPQVSSPEQTPQFVDWETQARAHIGVGPKDVLNTENQQKLDDIIKQKYQQVWGTTSKEANGEKASAPPAIQTYQEQLRAQRVQRQQIMLKRQQQQMSLAIDRLNILSPSASSSTSGSQSRQSIEEQAAARFPNDPVSRKDYENQLRALQQHNRQQMAMRMQQSRAHIESLQHSPNKSHALQDHRMQMMLLAQQNRKRLSMTQRENQPDTRDRKRMMMAPAAEDKNSKQPAEIQSDNTPNNTTTNESPTPGDYRYSMKPAPPSSCAAMKLENPVKTVSDYPDSGHSLRNYQMQLEQHRVKSGIKTRVPQTYHANSMMQERGQQEKETESATVAQCQPVVSAPVSPPVNPPQPQEMREQLQRFKLQMQQKAYLAQKQQNAANTSPNAMATIPQTQQTCPYGLAEYLHPGQHPTPNQNPSASTPYSAHGMFPYLTSLSGYPTSQNLSAPNPYSGYRMVPNDSPSTVPSTLSPYPTPGYPTSLYSATSPDLTPKHILNELMQNDNPSSSATSQSSNTHTAPAIQTDGSDASADSDWSRLSTPTEDEDFVVVEHGALPIRPARSDEQS